MDSLEGPILKNLMFFFFLFFFFFFMWVSLYFAAILATIGGFADSELNLIGVDGGKNPTFQEKFVFTLIEGLREVNAVVWNSNTLTYDDFIGSGK